ncbi:hypothetical protein [Helicobacter typhlonius]|uniref:hypothetical protein n=1 Tax=Helicobacter typhlonius TaxID=76936 RepID=UPI002FE2B5D7
MAKTKIIKYSHKNTRQKAPSTKLEMLSCVEKTLALRNFIILNANAKVATNHFLLFSYTIHCVMSGYTNLGDFIQTIATKNALVRLFNKPICQRNLI